MEPRVKLLRQFRERFLLRNAGGRTFVDFYYTYSPPIADFIARHNGVPFIVRWSLLPMVTVTWMTLNFGPWVTIGVVVLLLCLMSAGAGFTLRRIRLKHQA
jgi:hypothetical protein